MRALFFSVCVAMFIAYVLLTYLSYPHRIACTQTQSTFSHDDDQIGQHDTTQLGGKWSEREKKKGEESRYSCFPFYFTYSLLAYLFFSCTMRHEFSLHFTHHQTQSPHCKAQSKWTCMCIFVFLFISLIVKSDQLFFSWGELEEGNMHAAVRKKRKVLV